MFNVTQLLEFARSVCFGALAVSSLLLLAHAYFPAYFPADVSRWEVFYAGTVLGTLLHRALHWLLFNPVSQAAGRSLSFYAKFAELNLLRRTGALTEGQFKNVADQFKADYFGVPVERLTERDRPTAPAGPPARQEIEAAEPPLLDSRQMQMLSLLLRQSEPRPHTNKAQAEAEGSFDAWPGDESRPAARAGADEVHAADKGGRQPKARSEPEHE